MSDPKKEPSKPSLRAIEVLKIQLGPNQISEDQGNRIKKVTEACLMLGQVILESSKPSPDQSVAIRKLRELKYTVVAGISSEEFL